MYNIQIKEGERDDNKRIQNIARKCDIKRKRTNRTNRKHI